MKTILTILWWVAFLSLLFAPLVQAQDHAAIVAKHAAVVQPTEGDPCAGFEVAMRTAWELRAEGAGVLVKARGPNVDGNSRSPYGCWLSGTLYAYDIVIYPDGTHYDLFIGDTMKPVWNRVICLDIRDGCVALGDAYKRPDVYGLAIDPGLPDSGPIEPTPPPVDLAPILTRLSALETEVIDLRKQQEQDTKRLQAGIDLLAARPFPSTECRASFFGIRGSCRLVVP